MTAPAIDGQAYIMHKLDGLGRLVEAVDRLSTMIETRFPNDPGTSKSPGLRPLHIEDGQVQEAVDTVKSMQDNALSYGAALQQAQPSTSSVPEAEPPEQEDNSELWTQIAAYVSTVAYKAFLRGFESAQVPIDVSREIQAGWYVGSGFDVETIQKYYPLSAAHREYAQPGKGV